MASRPSASGARQTTSPRSLTPTASAPGAGVGRHGLHRGGVGQHDLTAPAEPGHERAADGLVRARQRREFSAPPRRQHAGAAGALPDDQAGVRGRVAARVGQDGPGPDGWRRSGGDDDGRRHGEADGRGGAQAAQDHGALGHGRGDPAAGPSRSCERGEGDHGQGAAGTEGEAERGSEGVDPRRRPTASAAASPQVAKRTGRRL